VKTQQQTRRKSLEFRERREGPHRGLEHPGGE
jgi:hypothetical protein